MIPNHLATFAPYSADYRTTSNAHASNPHAVQIARAPGLLSSHTKASAGARAALPCSTPAENRSTASSGGGSAPASMRSC